MHTRLKQIRKQLELTQAQVAKKIEVSRQMITRYEEGADKPSYRVIKSFCNAFNVNIDYLVKGEGRVFDEIKIARLKRNKRILREVAMIKLDYNITQMDIEDELGFPNGLFKDLRKGTFTMSDDKIKKLEKKYNISIT